MANIQERISKSGKKSYRALVRRKGHPPESATFQRKTDAKRWAASVESAILEDRYFKSNKSRKRLVKDAINEYKDSVSPTNNREGYDKGYQLDWWNKQIGELSLAQLTPAKLAECRDKLKGTKSRHGKRKSNATMNRYLSAFSAMLNWAVKEKHWIDDNPMRAVKRPSEPDGRVRYLEVDEINRLETACENSSYKQLHLIFLIAVSTGMRRAEILNLEWKDIDLRRHQITLLKSKNKEMRTVPVRSKALSKLKEYKKARRMDTELLFPAIRNPQKPIKIDSLFNKAVAEAGISDYHFHDNRHTAASYLAMNGATALEITAVLGQKTLSMANRYAHLSDAHNSSIVEKMNNKLFNQDA